MRNKGKDFPTALNLFHISLNFCHLDLGEKRSPSLFFMFLFLPCPPPPPPPSSAASPCILPGAGAEDQREDIILKRRRRCTKNTTRPFLAISH